MLITQASASSVYMQVAYVLALIWRWSVMGQCERVSADFSTCNWTFVLRVVTSSIMDQFKEIPLLGSLLNFKKSVFY